MPAKSATPGLSSSSDLAMLVKMASTWSSRSCGERTPLRSNAPLTSIRGKTECQGYVLVVHTHTSRVAGSLPASAGRREPRGVYCEPERARLAVRRVGSAPQQALLAENPHDHGGDDQREEHAKPPEAIRAHHAPPPLRDCHRRGQQALSHGESGAKSSSYLGEAGCRWPSRVSLGAEGGRTRSSIPPRDAA